MAHLSALDAARPALRLVPRDEHMARMEALVSALETEMGAPEPEPDEMIGRGVYCTPWVYRGTRWLFAVDHTHNVIHLEPVNDGDRDAQHLSLQSLLDALDPPELSVL